MLSRNGGVKVKENKFTVVGTDIDEVKKQNAQSVPTYREIKEMIEKSKFENTSSNGNMIDPNTPQKYTIVGTDIEKVKKLNASSGPSYNEIFQMLDKEYEAE